MPERFVAHVVTLGGSLAVHPVGMYGEPLPAPTIILGPGTTVRWMTGWKQNPGKQSMVVFPTGECVEADAEELEDHRRAWEEFVASRS